MLYKNSETQLTGFMSPGSTVWIFQKITMECSKRVFKKHTYWKHHLPLCHTFLCHKEKCYGFEVSGLPIKNTSDVFRCSRHFVLVHIKHFHPMLVCQTAKTWCVKIFPSVLKLGSHCHLHTAVYKQSRITRALQPPEANKSTQEPDQAHLGFSVSCVHLPNNELQKSIPYRKNNIVKLFFLNSYLWTFTSFHCATFPIQTWNHL